MSGEGRYSRQTVEWVLRHLLDLRQGVWPDPESSELLGAKRHSQLNRAYFETPAGMAGIIESQLKQCGLDGLMVKIQFVMGESDNDLAKISRCSVSAVQRRINSAMAYISGKPKDRDYRDFRDHKKGG